MRRLIPILILCVLVGGCHIAADKSEVYHLTNGGKVIEAEGWGLNNNSIRAMLGQEPIPKPTGWLSHIKIQVAGDTGTVSTDTHHSFGMDGIQTPFTRQPGVNAVIRQGERKTQVTATGVETKQEEMKGLGVTELLWWIGGSALLIALITGVVYYYVPASRPIISNLISKLPGFGHSETEEKKK